MPVTHRKRDYGLARGMLQRHTPVTLDIPPDRDETKNPGKVVVS